MKQPKRRRGYGPRRTHEDRILWLERCQSVEAKKHTRLVKKVRGLEVAIVTLRMMIEGPKRPR